MAWLDEAMQVYAYRGEIEEKATIVDVFKNGARVKWQDDRSLSTFCLPYNQLRPVIEDDGRMTFLTMKVI